jgi:drug/metabolite transporter (DMT)-like permease
MKKPYIALLISIISVSFASIFILSITAPPLTISFYRLLFTTLIILPFILFNKKRQHELKTIPKKHILLMTFIGIILAAHFALWITSLTLTSVASSVILVTSHPILVAPLSYFLLKEKLSLLNTLGILVSVSGIILLVLGNYGLTAFTIDTLEGNILAMLGGMAAGLYIIGGRKLRKTVSIFPYAFIVYTAGTITLLCLCLITTTPILTITNQDLGIIFLMALVSGIFGHTLYNWSLEYIRASVCSVFLLGEPIGSSLLAYLIPWVAQQPSTYTLIGGGIALIGIYLAAKRPEPLKVI